jgi:arginine decarboxylase
LLNDGYNVIPVLDHLDEFDHYKKNVKVAKCQLGIRISTEEEPSFAFYSSRLGVRYTDIISLYKEKIQNNPKFELKLLHFFINNGIKDTIYYWTELNKCLNIYKELKKICPSLDSLNIGGGMPIRTSLSFDYNYDYMVEEIIAQVKSFCTQHELDEPNIFTEFGSFTVAESGATLYSIIDQKQQNDREQWYMIDSSFITTLPDTWGINQRFILLAVNNWDKPYVPVNLGGLTCDSMDYYNSEAHTNQVFLPKVSKTDKQPLYVGFFHTGAYQESLSGYGGTQHCLVPAPKHVLIDKDEKGEISTKLFAKEQSYKSMLKILGY